MDGRIIIKWILKEKDVRFAVLAAATVKNNIFWDKTPCW
jgi:hypothetical protein